MFSKARKLGLFSLVLGLILSAASAWCEVEAHLKIAEPVQEVGRKSTAGTVIYKESPSFYLASSMAVRLFSVGAIFIVVGAFQMQRAQISDRVARLERELESFRSRAASVA